MLQVQKPELGLGITRIGPRGYMGFLIFKQKSHSPRLLALTTTQDTTLRAILSTTGESITIISY